MGELNSFFFIVLEELDFNSCIVGVKGSKVFSRFMVRFEEG